MISTDSVDNQNSVNIVNNVQAVYSIIWNLAFKHHRKIENSVFPWCFSPGPNPASPQKDFCFKNHTDVSNIRLGVELLGSLGLSQ